MANQTSEFSTSIYVAYLGTVRLVMITSAYIDVLDSFFSVLILRLRIDDSDFTPLSLF